jgi:sodium-dependent phosphate transporter
VCGLALYGYNIMRAVGFKLTCITPSRGFCIELATALAVSLASFMQIPVSSTQCLVGATVGAGIASGGFKQVQWFYLFRVTTGWVGTFFITAVVTAGLFSFATYSPSL